ncbi:MAG: histidine kinase, partial [Bacteroidia bacterium]
GFAGIFTHKLNNGQHIEVEVYSSSIEFENKKVRLVMANDITDKLNHLTTIETQNKKLKHIAWTQSHVVRAPLSRMLGIVNLIELESFNADDIKFLLEQLKQSAGEVDNIIKDIVNKTQTFNIKDS